jgi:hypothetical protein
VPILLKGVVSRRERASEVKRLIVGTAAVAVTLVAASAANAHVFTIHGDWRMGSFAAKRDGTLGGAIEAFGRPGSRDRSREFCTIRWPRHGLKIVFYNLGGENPCSRTYGFFSNARAKGPHWRTNRGLEIGDWERRLRNLYPKARFHPAERSFWPAGWWLVRRWSPFGTGGYYPGLLARMDDRRVASFHVSFAAGGE